MRMTASWSGSKRTDRIQVCGARFAPNGELPSDDHANIRAIRRLSFEEGPHLLFISPPRADAAPGQVDR
jgi:hypothetical protein